MVDKPSKPKRDPTRRKRGSATFEVSDNFETHLGQVAGEQRQVALERAQRKLTSEQLVMRIVEAIDPATHGLGPNDTVEAVIGTIAALEQQSHLSGTLPSRTKVREVVGKLAGKRSSSSAAKAIAADLAEALDEPPDRGNASAVTS